ncbi:MAG: type II toxin-antitoxin system Phd/YefM family antitoxin [Acidobacteriota bacterium]
MKMTKPVSSCHAKTHLSALLERVAKGERITITKHGASVAMLVPVEPNPAQLSEEIRRLRKGKSLAGLSIGQLVKTGRRF